MRRIPQARTSGHSSAARISCSPCIAVPCPSSPTWRTRSRGCPTAASRRWSRPRSSMFRWRPCGGPRASGTPWVRWRSRWTGSRMRYKRRKFSKPDPSARARPAPGPGRGSGGPAARARTGRLRGGQRAAGIEPGSEQVPGRQGFRGVRACRQVVAKPLRLRRADRPVGRL